MHTGHRRQFLGLHPRLLTQTNHEAPQFISPLGFERAAIDFVLGRILPNLGYLRAGLIILESLDRLSRDAVEMETQIRRIEHKGGRILGLCDGYDSESAPVA